MKRREAIKTIGIAGAASLIVPQLLAKGILEDELMDLVFGSDINAVAIQNIVCLNDTFQVDPLHYFHCTRVS